MREAALNQGREIALADPWHIRSQVHEREYAPVTEAVDGAARRIQPLGGFGKADKPTGIRPHTLLSMRAA
jgi:hypothetical protein